MNEIEGGKKGGGEGGKERKREREDSMVLYQKNFCTKYLKINHGLKGANSII